MEFLEELGIGESTGLMIVDYGVKILGALLVLYLGFFFGKMAERQIRKRISTEKLDESLIRFVAQIARWGVIVFAVLACLSIFGIETTSFAAVIGGASVAIGLALQGSLSHLASGVMLLIFKPFTVGDVVDISSKRGKVVEIGLFAVTMDTPDRRRIIIPNGKVFGDTIENITHSETRRVDVAVGTDYDADISTTREVLLAAAAKVEKRIEEEPPVAYLDSLGGSSIDWSVRVICKTEDFWDVKAELTQLVKDDLDAAGIGIPYPHRVVISQNA